jgi:hypothetical protein
MISYLFQVAVFWILIIVVIVYVLYQFFINILIHISDLVWNFHMNIV